MPIVCIPELQRLRPTKSVKTQLSSGTYRAHLKPCHARCNLTDTEKVAAQLSNRAKHQRFQTLLGKAQDTVEAAVVTMMEECPGHKLEWYIHIILQMWTKSKKAWQDKNPSRWNAYLSIEVSHLNAKREPGTTPIKVSDIGTELGLKWKSFLGETKKAITDTKIKELEAAALAKTHGAHKSQVTRFHDARAVICHIQHEIINLYERTGIEILLMAVRSDNKMMMTPYLYHTSERVDGFFRQLCQILVDGADGVSRNYRDTLTELKMKMKDLIKEKLDDIAGVKTSRMNYQNFEQDITLKYSIVLKHWPLQKFACPSSISSLTHARILYNSFYTGSTYFAKLSDEDFEVWSQAYFARESRQNAVGITTVPLSLPENNAISATIAESLKTSMSAPSTHNTLTPTSVLTPTSTIPTVPVAFTPVVTGTSGHITSVDIHPPLQPITGPLNLISVTGNNGKIMFVPTVKRKCRSDFGKSKKKTTT
ncbi:hypothetical protein FA13DRAFT_1903600 [Coprinellus micaceus]|uniref:Uncharacterized protein n=1 Tax=Coprinellus micaceus TaxID=71717 RepID=A0A4Y7TQ32_COPMI|nr:hypothetical protein FA13DRAFT_1903600 [Coprinellus micaceus]